VFAVVKDAQAEPPVLCRESAAVVLTLPLYKHRVSKVHTLCTGGVRASSTSDVVRHAERLDDDTVIEIEGMRCTSLARTVTDVARTTSLEVGLACADAALRIVASRGRDYDEGAAEQLRDGMRSVLAASPGAHGTPRARWVVEFADGRAQLPGESVSRLRLFQLGFPAPRLQFEVPAPAGAPYHVDIAEDDWLGEFDGQDKYLDEAMRRGLSLERVLLEEKKREDWIRARTRRTLARWGDEHLATPQTLADRLAVYGIRAPRRPVLGIPRPVSLG
jgi:hypothetical protein